MSDQVGNPKDQFSHNEAHVISGYTDLILPLIEKYPCLLDRTGVGGTTCRQLLGQMVRRREGTKDEVIHPYDFVTNGLSHIYHFD